MQDIKQFLHARIDTLLPAFSRWVAEHVVPPVLTIIRSKAPAVYRSLATKAQTDPLGFEGELHIGALGFDWIVDLVARRLGLTFPEGSTAETVAETITGSIPRAFKDALINVDLQELSAEESEMPFAEAAGHLTNTLQEHFAKLKQHPRSLFGVIMRFIAPPPVRRERAVLLHVRHERRRDEFHQRHLARQGRRGRS